MNIHMYYLQTVKKTRHLYLFSYFCLFLNKFIEAKIRKWAEGTRTVFEPVFPCMSPIAQYVWSMCANH